MPYNNSYSRLFYFANYQQEAFSTLYKALGDSNVPVEEIIVLISTFSAWPKPPSAAESKPNPTPISSSSTHDDDENPPPPPEEEEADTAAGAGEVDSSSIPDGERPLGTNPFHLIFDTDVNARDDIRIFEAAFRSAKEALGGNINHLFLGLNGRKETPLHVLIRRYPLSDDFTRQCIRLYFQHDLEKKCLSIPSDAPYYPFHLGLISSAPPDVVSLLLPSDQALRSKIFSTMSGIRSTPCSHFHLFSFGIRPNRTLFDFLVSVDTERVCLNSLNDGYTPLHAYFDNDFVQNFDPDLVNQMIISFPSWPTTKGERNPLPWNLLVAARACNAACIRLLANDTLLKTPIPNTDRSKIPELPIHLVLRSKARDDRLPPLRPVKPHTGNLHTDENGNVQTSFGNRDPWSHVPKSAADHMKRMLENFQDNLRRWNTSMKAFEEERQREQSSRPPIDKDLFSALLPNASSIDTLFVQNCDGLPALQYATKFKMTPAVEAMIRAAGLRRPQLLMQRDRNRETAMQIAQRNADVNTMLCLEGLDADALQKSKPTDLMADAIRQNRTNLLPILAENFTETVLFEPLFVPELPPMLGAVTPGYVPPPPRQPHHPSLNSKRTGNASSSASNTTTNPLTSSTAPDSPRPPVNEGKLKRSLKSMSNLIYGESPSGRKVILTQESLSPLSSSPSSATSSMIVGALYACGYSLQYATSLGRMEVVSSLLSLVPPNRLDEFVMGTASPDLPNAFGIALSMGYGTLAAALFRKVRHPEGLITEGTMTAAIVWGETNILTMMLNKVRSSLNAPSDTSSKSSNAQPPSSPRSGPEKSVSGGGKLKMTRADSKLTGMSVSSGTSVTSASSSSSSSQGTTAGEDGESEGSGKTASSPTSSSNDTMSSPRGGSPSAPSEPAPDLRFWAEAFLSSLPRTLDLRECNLSTLRLPSVVSILPFTSVNLSGNNFQRIPLSVLKLPKLRRLDLSNNKIDWIRTRQVRSLREFIGNNLKEKTDVFSLNLRRNQLTTIPSELYSIGQLEVDTWKNPLMSGLVLPSFFFGLGMSRFTLIMVDVVVLILIAAILLAGGLFSSVANLQFMMTAVLSVFFGGFLLAIAYFGFVAISWTDQLPFLPWEAPPSHFGSTDEDDEEAERENNDDDSSGTSDFLSGGDDDGGGVELEKGDQDSSNSPISGGGSDLASPSSTSSSSSNDIELQSHANGDSVSSTSTTSNDSLMKDIGINSNDEQFADLARNVLKINVDEPVGCCSSVANIFATIAMSVELPTLLAYTFISEVPWPDQVRAVFSLFLLEFAELKAFLMSDTLQDVQFHVGFWIAVAAVIIQRLILEMGRHPVIGKRSATFLQTSLVLTTMPIFSQLIKPLDCSYFGNSSPPTLDSLQSIPCWTSPLHMVLAAIGLFCFAIFFPMMLTLPVWQMRSKGLTMKWPAYFLIASTEVKLILALLSTFFTHRTNLYVGVNLASMVVLFLLVLFLRTNTLHPLNPNYVTMWRARVGRLGSYATSLSVGVASVVLALTSSPDLSSTDLGFRTFYVTIGVSLFIFLLSSIVLWRARSIISSARKECLDEVKKHVEQEKAELAKRRVGVNQLRVTWVSKSMAAVSSLGMMGSDGSRKPKGNPLGFSQQEGVSTRRRKKRSLPNSLSGDPDTNSTSPLLVEGKPNDLIENGSSGSGSSEGGGGGRIGGEGGNRS